MMPPDETKEYSHGCGSPRECQMAEVMAGYIARAASSGKAVPSEIREYEGISKSVVGGQRPKQTRRSR
jgi:hypothetical protein